MNKRIFAVCLFALTAILIVGCSGAKEDERKKALENALEAIKSGDSDKAEQYILVEEESDNASIDETVTEMATEEKEAQEALAYLFQHLSYKIGDVKKEEENSAVIEAEIKQADLGEATTAAISELLLQSMALAFSDKTEAEIDAEIEDLYISKFKTVVDNNKDNLVTKKIDVQMKKVDGEWKVVGDDEFYNTVSGGMTGAIMEFAESFDMEENTDGATE